MDSLYTKKHQLEALKIAAEKYPKLKIGYSYPTLMKYEKNGVVNPAEHQLAVNNRNWRFYSGEEIAENVQRVIAHKKEQLLKH